MPCVGYLGFGEVGYYQAKGLSGEGLREIVAFVEGPRNHPPYTPAFRARAADAGVRLVDSLAELCESSEIIISAVTTDSAHAVAARAAPFLGAAHLFVDVNSCSPQTKLAAAEPVLRAGARFIDAALMGGAAYGGHRQPLYVSGSGAGEFAGRLAPYNLAVVVLDETIGTASTLKMIRSVGTKGFLALLWEVASAAHSAGIDLDRFGDILWPLKLGTGTDFATAAEAFILRGAMHVERRAHEMADALATMQALEVDTTMTEATARALRRLADLDLRQQLARGGSVADLLDVASHRNTSGRGEDRAPTDEEARGGTP